MTIYTRPDASVPVWAESGDKVQPTNPEVQTGWPLSTTPPSRQRFNWLQNFMANGLRYLLQRGIAQWSADEDYPQYAQVQHGGEVYVALVANSNVTPGTDMTKWVLKALGNLRGYLLVSVSTTLTAADMGKFVVVAPGVTVTLPDPTTVPDGTAFAFRISTGGAIFTIAGASTTISFSGNGQTKPVAMPSDVNGLAVVRQSAWEIINGSATLKYESQFASFLSANGYQKLPSGLIIQWGACAGNGDTSPTVVAFPIAFPTAVISIETTVIKLTAGETVPGANPSVFNQSAAGFDYYGQRGAFWFAVGH